MAHGYIDVRLRIPFTSDATPEHEQQMGVAMLEALTRILGGETVEEDVDGYTVEFDGDHTTFGSPAFVWGDLRVNWPGGEPREVPYGWAGPGQVPHLALGFLLGYMDYYAVGPGEAGVEIAKTDDYHTQYGKGWEAAADLDTNLKEDV